MAMYYGLIDVEMTCDGRKINGKFVDDGRMKHSQREVISVGFVVVDEKYRIKAKYSSFVKPVHNPIITSYCQELTGITQKNVDGGKKCNDAFQDIFYLCRKFDVKHILSFGNCDKMGLSTSVKWIKNKNKKEKVWAICTIAKKIVDVQPALLKVIYPKGIKHRPGLKKIADKLQIIGKKAQHNALNDTILLASVCDKAGLVFTGNEICLLNPKTPTAPGSHTRFPRSHFRNESHGQEP